MFFTDRLRIRCPITGSRTLLEKAVMNEENPFSIARGDVSGLRTAAENFAPSTPAFERASSQAWITPLALYLTGIGKREYWGLSVDSSRSMALLVAWTISSFAAIELVFIGVSG
jgi:hypothetical protein